MKFSTAFYALAATLTIALTSACDLEGCDQPDCGSCGGACCKLEIAIPGESTTQVMVKLKTLMESGGPDGLYTPQMTDGGTMSFGDLRGCDTCDADYIGQVQHTTINLMYNDTINFAISADSEATGSVVTGFSISQTAGSYCDSGQNHWNIVQLIKGVEWEGEIEVTNLLGCPQAAAPTKDEKPNFMLAVPKHAKKDKDI
jgi:hypothetical protein